MNPAFKNIVLFARQRAGNESNIETLNDLINLLEKENYKVRLETETAELIPQSKALTVSILELTASDLLIVVGGDGSLLQAARTVVTTHTPVLGINRGRLGFLTDILPREIKEQVLSVLKGKYTVEERFLLDTKIEHHNGTIEEGDALNDIVLMHGNMPGMCEFTIFINNELVCYQRADGVIIATPTGSTAYALSGGGPILHPALNAMVMLPMFPHTLSSRPLVVSGDSHFTLRLDANNKDAVRLSCDGQKGFILEANDVIHIYKKPQPLKLIHPLNYEYYHTLRSKLGWQSKHFSG